jgi:glycosyltransferase involved in cell wall biosynthesis
MFQNGGALMRLLFVHDRFGAMAGAEVNLQLTAAELKNRGHIVGLLHGPSTGKGEQAWMDLFHERFALGETSPKPMTRVEPANHDTARCSAAVSAASYGGVSPPVHGKRNNSEATRNALEVFQPDAIYIHKMSNVSVLKLLAESGVPIARMVHDHDLYCMRSYKYFPLTRTICTRGAGLHCIFPCGATLARNRTGGWPVKWVSYRARKKEIALNRRFARMIVATDYMRQELLRNGFDSRRIEIHAPVPQSDNGAARASFSDRNLIIYSGQVIRGKGVDVLLESLARVRAPFECLIFGDGNHRAYCEALNRKLGLADRVHFQGYVPPVELQKYYEDASIAVVSSVWPEPFGAVGLEAMRHGLPVVAFDAGGIKEWLLDGQNGFRVPWMDRARFAQSVEKLLKDKTLGRQMGERGRQLLRDKFNFDKYISDLEEMFSRIINKGEKRELAEISK